MSARAFLALARAALLLSTLSASEASAQFARRRVPQGEVTGLEMGIQGGLRAIPGERLRWELTLFEVVRRTDLRPSPGSRVRATSSSAPATVLAEVTTDAAGRASVELPITEALETGPHLMLEAVSPRGIRRVFEVDLELGSRFEVELHVDRDVAPPSGSVLAFGRVLDRAQGRAAAGREVVLRAAGPEGPLGPPVTTQTDPAGVFRASFTLPERGEVRIAASGDGLPGAAVVVRVETPSTPALVVTAQLREAVLAPGGATTVDVLVRTPNGAPVAGAQVDWEEEARLPEDERANARTDAEGRASLSFTALRHIEGAYLDYGWMVRAVHPAHGSERVRVPVRVARQAVFASWVVEGGALVPELEGQVLVRLAGPDGAPLAERDFTLEVPRLGGALSGRTDADGVARVQGVVRASAADDPCGGPTAAGAELVVGSYRDRFCLPVDPDATLTVAAQPLEGAHGLRVSVARRSSVARAPVVVTALVRRGEHWTPLAQVSVAAGTSRADLRLPDTAQDEVWVRARAVVDSLEVRGGGVLRWVGPAPGGLGLRVSEDGARLTGMSARDTVAVLALDPTHAEALLATVRGRLGPVGAALDAGAGAGLASFLSASRTPRDEAVSAVLREGQLHTLPMPSEPVREGLLRDPWRTRARFVRGRIGRLMRAVEEYVAARVPGDGDDGSMDDVAVREGSRLGFNEDVLEGVLAEAGLGGEAATSLDGEPLDIAGLRAMDPAFTYDNVARRITRERLWQLLRMLRHLVHVRELDPRWARQGDPTQYLLAMLEAEDLDWLEEVPSRQHLVDAWGTPFALRPVRGRARFAFLEPVPDYELVSAGPDGRFGTGDDMADPFARVLPSGSLYAEAVGEDTLLANLDGVALGRATVESLGAMFDVEAPELGNGDERAVVATVPLPSRLEPARIGPVPVAPPPASVGDVGSTPERSWTLPPERRRYAAVAIRYAPSGPPSTAEASLTAGAPYAVSVELPSVMRPGEALLVPIVIVQLAEAGEARVTVESRSPALSAAIDGSSIRLTASAAGLARVAVSVRVDERLVYSHETLVRVVPTGTLRARHASAWVTDRAALSAPTPADARAWRARLIVTAPRRLDADPTLGRSREAHPGPFAWARALRGEADPALVAAARNHVETPIEAACALMSLGEDDAGAIPRALQALERQLGDDLATRAAVLAALAPAAPGLFVERRDPVALLATRLREDGWRALGSTTDQPAVMARVAAALLLVDREDVRGLALLERAREAVQDDAYGRPSVPGDDARAGDGWIGTLALAIAERQAGEDTRAGVLARAAASQLVLAPRTGPEGVFWALAASVYGAFGVEAPENVTVVVDGRERVLALSGGVAELALSPRARVEVRGQRVLARVESRFVTERVATDGPLRVAIEGEPGGLGDRSALELVVEGRDEVEVGAPVVELTLPGAARMDETALATLRRASAVRRVEAPDAVGLLRIELRSLAAGGTHRLPLPWRWVAAGRTRGLQITSYDASQPWRTSAEAGRELTVEESR
jgi:hypothetical protein